jgi:hypothetical protein
MCGGLSGSTPLPQRHMRSPARSCAARWIASPARRRRARGAEAASEDRARRANSHCQFTLSRPRRSTIGSTASHANHRSEIRQRSAPPHEVLSVRAVESAAAGRAGSACRFDCKRTPREPTQQRIDISSGLRPTMARWSFRVVRLGRSTISLRESHSEFLG